MTEDNFQRLIMAIAVQVRDVVEDVYRQQLDDALADRRVLVDMIEAEGDAHMVEAARALVASRQPDRRQWHDFPPAGHA